MKNNLKYLKLYEDFSQKSIPELIKKISYTIRKDVLTNGNISFTKHYIIDAFDILLNIRYKNGNYKPYHSDVNIYDILSGKETIDIIVDVQDINIDIDYLMSIISHEIRHIYDIYTMVEDSDFEEFKKIPIINKYKNDFTKFVYLCLEHELIARNNMLYELYRWINITDKTELYKIFKNSYTYKALIDLKNFDYKQFSKIDNCYNFTVMFSKEIGDVFDGDLEQYYKKWFDYFNNKSIEYLSYVDDMLDEVINDVKDNKIYERICGFSSYNEDIFSNVSIKLYENFINNFLF